MGALFALLSSGREERAGFAMHPARLCAFANKSLGNKEQTIDSKIIVVQSVACLALLVVSVKSHTHSSPRLNMQDIPGPA